MRATGRLYMLTMSLSYENMNSRKIQNDLWKMSFYTIMYILPYNYYNLAMSRYLCKARFVFDFTNTVTNALFIYFS